MNILVIHEPKSTVSDNEFFLRQISYRYKLKYANNGNVTLINPIGVIPTLDRLDTFQSYVNILNSVDQVVIVATDHPSDPNQYHLLFQKICEAYKIPVRQIAAELDLENIARPNNCITCTRNKECFNE